MKFIRVLYLMTACAFALNGCTPHDTLDIPSSTSSTVVIDNFASGFSYIKAIYNPSYHSVHVEGTTNTGQSIAMGFYTTAGILNTYNFQPNGTNTAVYANQLAEIGFSDLNNNTIGGSLTLSKLDSNTQKLSGTFAYKTYNPTFSRYNTITSGKLEDVPLEIASIQNTPNDMKCTANGNEWFCDLVRTSISQKNSTDSSLRVEAYGLEGNRYLLFTIPLAKGTGNFDIKTEGTGNELTECRSTYYLYKNEWNYMPFAGSGTLNIISIDPAAKKLQATFNLQVKNGSGDIISFTSGALNVGKW